MLRRNSRLFSLGLFFALLGMAQQEDPVFRSDTRLVVLHATVVDSRAPL